MDLFRKVGKTELLACTIMSVLMAVGCIVSMIIMYYNTAEMDSYTNKKMLNSLGKEAITAAEIVQLYNDNYIGEMDIDDLYSFLVMATGDKYGSYLNKEETEYTEMIRDGSLKGIGVSLVNRDGSVVIESVVDGGPAEASGIKKGDIIVYVDDVDCKHKTSAEVANMIRGKEGTAVEVVVNSEGKENTFKITRQEIKLKEVSYENVAEKSGVIKVDSFNHGTDENIKKAIDSMKEAGVKNIVFDLRDNGGGVVSSATDALDYILGECNLITIEYKGDDNKHVIKSDENKVDGLEYVCLVNESTASAAELFALSLRDNADVKIVGNKTYGKGTVLSVYRLSNGGSLNVSTGQYKTDKSGYIEEVGISPDIEVKDTRLIGGTDKQMEIALNQFN